MQKDFFFFSLLLVQRLPPRVGTRENLRPLSVTEAIILRFSSVSARRILRGRLAVNKSGHSQLQVNKRFSAFPKYSPSNLHFSAAAVSYQPL